MFYEELMMDMQTLLKFKLFSRILTLKNLSHPIAQLAKEMNSSYQQTFIELTEIDEDLKELYPAHQSILGKAGKLQPDHIMVSIDEYRYFLLKRSIPFLYVLYLLNENEPTIEKFCEKYHVSRSTVSRKFEKVKHYLRQFNLRFTYTESNMVGEERLTRLALFHFIWLGARGLEWPFVESEAAAEKFIGEFIPYFPAIRSSLGELELKYFAAITLTRIKTKNFTKYDKRYNFLMKNNDYYDLEKIEKVLPVATLSEKEIKAESSFLYLVAQMLPTYTQSDDPTLKHTLDVFQKSKNPLYPMIEHFITFMQKGFFKPYPEILEDPILKGNLLSTAFSSYVFRQPFPSVYQLKDSTEETMVAKKMRSEVTTFIDEYKNNNLLDFINTSNKEQLIISFTNLLLPLYDHVLYTNHLQVGLALEDNLILAQGLFQFLKDLRFIDVSIYDRQQKQSYDVVISSNQLVKRINPDLKCLLWDYTSRTEQYIQLYYQLKELFDQKNIAYIEEIQQTDHS